VTTLWLAIANVNWGAEEVLGVFSTEQAAQAACDQDPWPAMYGYEVRSCQLDEPIRQ